MSETYSIDPAAYERVLAENEQLQTSLETVLEENARLTADRDRLAARLARQSREMMSAGAPLIEAWSAEASSDPAVAAERRGQVDEELNVAFEEMQVLTEELEAANNNLVETNRSLERRVEERTHDLTRANAALRHSELRLRTLAEGMPQLAWRAVENGLWTWCSPRWSAFTGLSAQESLGRGWLDAIHTDDRAAVEGAWDRAAAGGDLLDFETRVFHVAEQRYRHVQMRALPARDDNGRPIEWLGAATDIDDLVRLQHRQEVLVAELQHRTRNLMAVVQAITKRTLDESDELSTFAVSIFDRLGALARVQGLLSRRGEMRVSFQDLVREELAAHVELDGNRSPSRVTLDGPADAYLRSATVQTLALALHELATNAAKYGAFKAPMGRLDVRWRVQAGDGDDSTLCIDWIESGVANMPDADPELVGDGYGRELIERALPYQLGAATEFHLGPDGARCSIRMPIPSAAAGDRRSRIDQDVGRLDSG
jgi:PAS domain S-box-containing protein